VIATNVEKARDHDLALHHAKLSAGRFDQSANHVGGVKMEEGERDCDRDDIPLSNCVHGSFSKSSNHK
jgi:hypothetical protein